MKSGNRLGNGYGLQSFQKAAKRATVEPLEGRRLLSATADIPNLSVDQGLLLPSGERLLISNSNTLIAISPDGTFDTSFGNNGSAAAPGMTLGDIHQMGIPVNPIAVDSSGDILVAGSISGGDGAVARFHADGTIDSTFGEAGVASIHVGTGNPAFVALALQADGKIVAVGDSNGQNDEEPIWQFAAARFNTDGSPDLGFNGTGLICVGLPGTKGVGTSDFADTVAIQADGKILVGGLSDSTTGPTNPASGFGLIRLNTDGTLDEQFGDGGKVVTYFSNAPADSVISLDRALMTSMFVRNDGKILAVGEGQLPQIVAALYNADGTLDTDYGTDGRVFIDATSGSAEHVRMNPDGGFDVMQINDESVVSKVDANGNWLEDPETLIGPVTTLPAPLDLPAPTDPVAEPILGTPVVIVNLPLGHVALRKNPISGAVAGQLFAGTVTRVSGISQAIDQTQGTVDWGDGSAPVQANLVAVTGRPALTAVNATHQYTTAGSYHVQVTLNVGNVKRTLNRVVQVTDRTPNGRTLRASTGKVFTHVVGHVRADVLALNADITAAYITLDWGDGTNASTGVAKKHGDGYDIVASHTYQTHGQYRVIAKREITSPPGVFIDYFQPVVFVSLVNVA